MKIIALSCSPSKGRNSDTMLDYFIKGVKEVSGMEIEKIYLDDILIDTYKYENRLGPTKDEKDFAILTDKIQKAKGLIISTPTYNFSVPANLKNFIDRIRFISLDLNKKNSFGQPVGKFGYLKTYFIISGGTPNWAEKILFFSFPAFWLRGIFLYFGAKVIGAIYSGDIKTFENKRVLDKCLVKGKKYANNIKYNKNHGLLERIFFRPPQL